MNEKGFMFPVTLCILLIFMTFLSIHFNQYISEKRYLLEIEDFERNQFYFLLSMKKVESQLQEGLLTSKGNFIYEEGTVSYSISKIATDLFQITYRLNTDEQTDLVAMSYYDTNVQKMVKWLERN
ncbi:competence type IV pilus minor pilin ComGG [Robertmurraya andreesenii]|uniref:Competence protein ComGG n=1 Tax=Anoxybacillus andreesenii TaxID=1325932 RepID=A0ABT9V636_9BACL|nr:competence type IV pilus minor pilin ComGG [Robertmurraya andreesenii]MDQ0156406.1 competence protein ComGG [Robertmurraya andreesenii]